MTVEITPSGNASVLAQQLLAVAAADDRFRVEDVLTTTSGPRGLAFLVPPELHAAWEDIYLPKPVEEPELKPRTRGRASTKKNETEAETED